MRVSLALVLGLLIVSGNAHATRARLTALGQSKNGSLFIRDERNVFLNPAHISNLNNRINLEAGSMDRVSTAATANDTTNDPKAEGGIAYNFGGLTGGVQVGRVSEAADRINNQTALTTDFYDPQNSVELILGGKAGIGWGASLHHAQSKDDASASGGSKQNAQVLSARGGVVADRFQVYGVLDAIHDSKIVTTGPAVTQKYDGNLSLEVGGSFDLSQSSSVGGFVSQSGYDFDDDAGTKGDNTTRALSGSFFHRFRQDESVFVFGSAGLFWMNQESDYDAAGVQNGKYEQLSIPVALGLETSAASWLKLRGSVTQHVLIHQVKQRTATLDSKSENTDSTIVTLGTGIVFDKFVVDGTLSGTGSAGNGRLDGDNLMANIGMTYEF